MDDVMIDIETLGTSPGCVIWEIAAVQFDLKTGQAKWELHFVFDVNEAERYGLEIEPETEAWWERLGGIEEEDTIPLRGGLVALAGFVALCNPKRIWSCGSDFDFPILKRAFEVVGRKEGWGSPWPYWKQRDFRTVWDLAYPWKKREKRNHRALEDCHQQVMELAEAVNELEPDWLFGEDEEE